MSFARNFALGQQIAQTALDTYDRARQQREFSDIQTAKPEESQGYTAQDGAQLEAIANAKDANGNPYYQVEAQPGGNYGIRANFEYAGNDGQMVPPGAVTGIQQRRVADFLGNRYDAEQLTPERLDALRGRALAGVISKTDPIRGLGLMQQLKAGEREDQRFAWETEAQPLKQRAAQLQVLGAERGERQGQRGDLVQQYEDSAMKMPEEEVRGALTSYLNTNKSDLPLLVTGTTKGGFMMAERNPQTGEIGPSFSVPLAVGRKLVVGRQLAEQGMGAEALKYLSGVDENITGVIERYNKQTLDVAKVNNDAAYRRGALANDSARVDIARENARFNRDRLTAKDKAESDAADFQSKVDGVMEGYQAAMAAKSPEAAAIYAREYDQLRATAPKGLRLPSINALNSAQKPGGDAKAVEVPEAGKLMQRGGQRFVTDGIGGEIPADANGRPIGIMPDRRAAALKAAGVPDNYLDKFQWNADGTAVGYNGLRFGLDELSAIPKELKRIERNTLAAEEDAKSSMAMHGALRRQREARANPPPVSNRGIGPRITFGPDPAAPSIYATPEEWEAYRVYQGR